MLEIKTLPESEVEITGEVPVEDFELCREQAIKELSVGVEIKGFRAGNVPEKILIEQIGEQAILEKMANLAMQKEYPKIITSRKIRAVGQPQIVITKIAKDNPLGFKIKTIVVPELEMPDYKKIAEGIMSKPVLSEKKEEEGEGKSEGENKEAQNAEAEKIKQAEKRRVEILDKVVEEVKTEIPKIFIEAEKNKMLNEIKGSISQTGLKWEDYLTNLKKTEEEIMKDWDKDALKRVKYGLVLNEIADKEKVEVPEEELDKETDKIMQNYKDLDRNRVKAYTYGIMRNEKVFNLLENSK